MTVEQIEKATDEARIHERIRSRLCETEDDVHALGIAVAEHTEWRRLGYVMEEEGLEVYDPERDPTAVRWAREEQATRRRAERQEAKRECWEQAEPREQARQEGTAKLVLTVPVDGETYRRLRACAATHGITPRHLIALLAERARTTPDGLVEVTPFAVESAADTEK
ncbi:hypothetical protein ACG5V6_24265 [Streptomyces chitinivorans]|uniref:Ribbon-helix-helix protein, CopG family n=2 Tax=Streptomyces chitinivorans TaxID=1257027 RepID=A0ABW7HZH0_9ACTN|nr:hypothetical protein [Streptomyces chitinivorans]MDH2412359.1 hypothetical protein [Streptomyces chitinivorans]